jgi:hypothetical protein
LHHDKATYEMISMLLHQVHNRLRHGCSCGRRESKEQNAHNPLALGVHKLAKILVLGDDYPFLARRHVTHSAILCAWKRLADRDNIKARESESPYDCEVAALIGQETHVSTTWCASSARKRGQVLFVRHDIRRVGYGGPNVRARQSWVRIK